MDCSYYPRKYSNCPPSVTHTRFCQNRERQNRERQQGPLKNYVTLFSVPFDPPPPSVTQCHTFEYCPSKITSHQLNPPPMKTPPDLQKTVQVSLLSQLLFSCC